MPAELFRTLELSDAAYERDGLRLATVKSAALGRRADATFWVPAAEQIGTLLILLHGVYGSHWVWTRKAGVHRTAQRMLAAAEIAPLVLAMPSDSLVRDGSAYLRWGHRGMPAEDVERWIVEELPVLARLAAPALASDAKIAIAGFSMGGYGALRLGAKYPGRFAAISSHSAITEIDDIASFVEEPLADYLACAPRDELSPLYWMRRNRADLPPVRIDCGIEDPLLESNRRLHQALLADRIEHTYVEQPGGHEWSYWERHVGETLRFVDRQSGKNAGEQCRD